MSLSVQLRTVTTPGRQVALLLAGMLVESVTYILFGYLWASVLPTLAALLAVGSIRNLKLIPDGKAYQVEVRRRTFVPMFYACIGTCILWSYGSAVLMKGWEQYFHVGMSSIVTGLVADVTCFFEWPRRFLLRQVDSLHRDDPIGRTARRLKWLLPTKVYERATEPFLADYQYEHSRALEAGQRGRALWLLVTCYVKLCRVVIGSLFG
jgi:hypothetical protein